MKSVDIKNNCFLAVDTAYQIGIVTVFRDREALFSYSLDDKMAHGKEICRALKEAMAFVDEKGLHLEGIFSGLGPGSFVGVRIALATILGFSFAKNLPLRGFCSHRALAATTPIDGHAYLFMKASGDLGYLTEYKNIDGILVEEIKPQVISVTQFLETSSDALVLSDMPEKLSSYRGEVRTIFGPNAEGIINAANDRLVSPFVDESDNIKPNYVKPPNVSLPKKSFIFSGQVD